MAEKVIRSLIYDCYILHYPARSLFIEAVDETFGPLVREREDFEKTSEFLAFGNKKVEDEVENSHISAAVAESYIYLMLEDIELAEQFCKRLRKALIATEGMCWGVDFFIRNVIHSTLNHLEFMILTCY